MTSGDTAVTLGKLPVGLVGGCPSQYRIVVRETQSGAVRTIEWPPPLAGRSARFLERVLGLDRGELLETVGAANLFDHKVERWRAREARVRARFLEENALPYLPWGRVVLLGRRVQRAFGVSTLEPFGVWSGSKLFAPHPSGLNRWWNDRGNRADFARFWREEVERC